MANSFKYKEETFGVGDTINVIIKVQEGEKTRQQTFTGLLIAIKGRQENTSFTVRKIGTHGVGVEKIFPVLSPDITNITLKARGKVRRSKLYYLRQRTGREALRVKAVKVEKKSDTAKKEAGPKGRKTSKKTASK
ncbi:50S ribosomal protein L19 [Patescibacteria group bacterium]